MSYSSEDLSSFLSSSVRVLPSNVSATGSNTNEETDGVANARELTPSVTETVPLVQQSVPMCGVIPEADTVPEEAVVPTIHEESVDHSSPVCTDVPEVESIPVEAVVPAEVPQAVASSSGAERLFDGCVDASQTDGSNDNALESDYNTLVPPGPTNTHSMVTRSKGEAARIPEHGIAQSDWVKHHKYRLENDIGVGSDVPRPGASPNARATPPESNTYSKPIRSPKEEGSNDKHIVLLIEVSKDEIDPPGTNRAS
ncbi:hypothetical protein V6N13_052929 [Hibiscus sabdariffa]